MFYSHEVLTSRKYGVATIWLVATLGSKSSLKKVTRKAILDVDVQKACETITAPTAPLALRLQSSLLYGVARVYSQQCDYVFHDAETARNNMRVLLKAIQASTLDSQTETKGRTDQLVLQDDPNFLPDFNLMPLDLKRLEMDLTAKDDSQRSTLSPYNSQQASISASSQYDIGGLIIPPSASSLIGGPVGGLGSLSVRGDSGAGTRVNIGGLDDDLGLAIDEDGTLRLPGEPQPQDVGENRQSETAVGGGYVVGSGGHGNLGQPDEDGFQLLQDDYAVPGATVAVPSRVEGEAQASQQETSEETAEAPLRIRARPAIKTIPLDVTMELHNRDLSEWSNNYLTNMSEAVRHKKTNQATAIAKKNAEHWILDQSLKGPLSIFSGANLLEALTGVNLHPAGQKRAREGDEDEDARQVRPRSEPYSDEVARGYEDDGYMPVMGDDTIEQGRKAPTPLEERIGSSIMPWNQSAESRRPTGAFSARGIPTSASLGGMAQQLAGLSGRPSRLTSASPLIGRGAAVGDIDELQLPTLDDDIAMGDTDDFELFGPAAGVDTQTAEQSQWQRAALDGESMHFLDFVQTGIEKIDEARDEAAFGDEEDEALKGSVDFDALLSPGEHTPIVAAQALLHVLSLGTKNLLRVEQEEAFGAITLRLVASA